MHQLRSEGRKRSRIQNINDREAVIWSERVRIRAIEALSRHARNGNIRRRRRRAKSHKKHASSFFSSAFPGLVIEAQSKPKKLVSVTLVTSRRTRGSPRLHSARQRMRVNNTRDAKRGISRDIYTRQWKKRSSMILMKNYRIHRLTRSHGGCSDSRMNIGKNRTPIIRRRSTLH